MGVIANAFHRVIVIPAEEGKLRVGLADETAIQPKRIRFKAEGFLEICSAVWVAGRRRTNMCRDSEGGTFAGAAVAWGAAGAEIVERRPAWTCFGEVAKIFHELTAECGADGLRMELNAPDRTGFVGHAHDQAILRPSSLLETLGQGLGHYERVIADGDERAGNIGEQTFSGMMHVIFAAVHRDGGVNHGAAHEMADALVAQTYAQNGNVHLTDNVF